jgi:hypothetical protein
MRGFITICDRLRAGQATIEVSDIYGTRVRTMTGPAAKGLNHAAWNLRSDPPPLLPIRPRAAPEDAAPAVARVAEAAVAAQSGRSWHLAATSVVIKVPGLQRDLRGEVTVEADPIRK